MDLPSHLRHCRSFSTIYRSPSHFLDRQTSITRTSATDDTPPPWPSSWSKARMKPINLEDHGVTPASPVEIECILSKIPTCPVIDRSSSSVSVIDLGDGTVVKYGSRRTLATEAAATEFVRRHTSIPVPRVHKAFYQGRKTYIVMDHMGGETLLSALRKSSFSSHEVECLVKQLCDCLRELHAVAPHTRMCSWPSGPLENQNFDPPCPREFRFVDEFHSYWWGRWEFESRSSLPTPRPLPLAKLGDRSRIVLSHGDLSAKNILVKDGKLVAILDWATLGWYPDFWEPVMVAHINAQYGLSSWIAQVCAGLGYPRECLEPYIRLLYEIYVVFYT